MKPKVLVLVGSFEVGGTEQHLARVLPKLHQHGFDITIYTLNPRGRLREPLLNGGIVVAEPPQLKWIDSLPQGIGRVFKLVVFSIAYMRLLKVWRPHIVHFFLPQAYLIGGILSLPFRRLVRIMSRRSLNLYQNRHPYWAQIEKILHNKMNVILGNSIAVLRNLRAEGIPERKLVLLYNGLDVQAPVSIESKRLTRSRMGLVDDCLLLVCAANLHAYKGHEDLLRALGRVSPMLPSGWSIAMLGRDMGLGKSLRDLSAQLGLESNVMWLGDREDAQEIIAAADIGVLCSHQEGFSNSVIEYMANGLASIVTEVGGNSEAIKHGENGLVVQAQDIQAIADAILVLGTQESIRTKMGESARRRAVEYFSLDGCVGSYARLYKGLLKTPPSDMQTLIQKPTVAPGA
jgi:glycosyltransferase involved in cell wall biosynthesis